MFQKESDSRETYMVACLLLVMVNQAHLVASQCYEPAESAGITHEQRRESDIGGEEGARDRGDNFEMSEAGLLQI